MGYYQHDTFLNDLSVNFIRLLILSTAFFMANAFEYTSCTETMFGAELELTFDPNPLVAGQDITVTVSSDFSRDITADTNIYIKLLERELDNKPVEKCVYKQKICIGNEALCPISVGKKVKVTAKFMLLNDININNLIMIAYIGTPRNSDSVVETFGCQCYSNNALYCADLSHGS
ncbi:5313_t:CDS:2 [Cetraspora pellucida]|uniref:5313_t:CDS:1 n=1 Tax=Cetraspora pellucida TaxID=1433469 RepID=A0A9N8YZ95_9GLOM|nr:5313_t:CDS:2 [Cetraspora pellucida]